MTRRLAAPLVAAALAASGCATSTTASSSRDLHGRIPDVPAARPRFVLTDTSGTPYDFAARTRGRVTLLFWGYTNCDDTCPATMRAISIALRRVPESVRRHVTVVFATTDPARDSPARVRRWLDRIDPSFVGLTGAPAQIAAAQDAAGVPRAVRAAGSGKNYAVEHYAATTAYGRDDRVAVVYPSNTGASDFAADLPSLVKGGP